MFSCPFMSALIRKFYRNFVRTLNTIIYDPAEKLRITIDCPINPTVVKDCKSNENPISLLDLLLHSVNFSLAVAPPTIFGDRHASEGY